jgi:hypothetical protein
MILVFNSLLYSGKTTLDFLIETGPVRRILKDVPFIALTAITPAVRRDILKSLELNQSIVMSIIIFI